VVDWDEPTKVLEPMPKRFNTAGPCDPDRHYMLPPERRLPGVRELVAEGSYFVVHAPRQVGKTTCFQTLAAQITAEGDHAALHASCERGQSAGGDTHAGMTAILRAIERRAGLDLPEELRPTPVENFLAIEPESRLIDYLTAWSQNSPRPVALFLDEIDALLDETLLSVLRQLREGYTDRPAAFPHAVALIGLRDVRDYRVQMRSDHSSLGTASPFNIKVESLTLRNFTAAEVAELYRQHTVETGKVFTEGAEDLAFELTRGHPWLVNALARLVVEKIGPERTDVLNASDFEKAKELLIERRDTHLDSLIDRLRETRVRRVIEPILSGELLSHEVLDDDVRFAEDLGLVVPTSEGLDIANPIYREVIPRALTQVMESSLPLPRPSYVGADGRLRFDQLLADFRSFWLEHGEALLAQAPYSEAAAQLVFMAFLHKVVNGGGYVDREYATGRGRIDLCVRWPHAEGEERWAIELKVWRDGRPDPLEKGLEQLTSYLERLGLESGTLLIFDQRSEAPPLPERLAEETHEHFGRTLHVLRF